MSLFLIILLNCFFKFIEGNNVNNIIFYLHATIIQFLNIISKSKIRKLWEEDPSYNRYEGEDNEKYSIDKYCKGPFTDYKYNIFYEVGKYNYTFTDDEDLINHNNDYNAVS